MRNKENRLVITFHSTTEAIEAEKRLKELGVPGRLIPIPRQLSAGCGLAWSAPEREWENVIQSVGLMQLSFEKMAVVQI
ncbi:DUF3343 domain-containing protein [Lachnospiraceae bacterium HCP1S3_A8]